MKILCISSEYDPLAKSGGLADAVGSLARSLAAHGHDVRVVLPRYYFIDRNTLEDMHLPLGVPLGRHEEWCAVYRSVDVGVTLYFLEHEGFFGRDGIYGETPASAYPDNARRFAFLSRGALQLAQALEFDAQIVHAHDWPAAPAMVYHRLHYRAGGAVANARTVISIHNLGYQGIFASTDLEDLGIDPWTARRERLLVNGSLNFLAGGLAAADMLTTVSPRYAQEIQTPQHGFGLDQLIASRSADLVGIINGIDVADWNPKQDPRIPHTFSVEDRSGKALCKSRLQQEMGLAVDPDVPVIGMITRLVDQKGIGALFGPTYGSMYRICSELPVQVVLLGSGADWCEREVRNLHNILPNFAAVLGYNNTLAHTIEAAADFFLMPSVYEPCGLNQMYSMRYGTLPIVTRTGGLADTVDEETGFFVEHYSPEGIFLAVETAVDTFRRNRARIEQMRTTAMHRDFSWSASARHYEDLYSRLL